MTDFSEIEEMLEAQVDRRKAEENKDERMMKSNDDSNRHKKTNRRRSRSRSHHSARSRRHDDRRRRRSRSRSTSRSRRKRSISRDRRDRKMRDDNPRKRSLSRGRRQENASDNRSVEQLTEEEKDARTIYIWQLSLRVRTRDLEEFFAQVGKMDVVRLVLDNKTGKSRGVAFIQFKDVESVNKALDLNGQKLMGVPIQIRTVSSEKCRAAEGTMNSSYIYFRGPTKLCVSNLHSQINEQMIEEIFAPYGKIDELRLMKDMRGNSLGTAFILFRKGENAKNVVEQMNDFNLAGQLLKIAPVVEEGGLNEFGENQGVSMTAADRLGLMAKLAVGTGLQVVPKANAVVQAPIINSQCFVLSNMFDVKDAHDDKFCKEVQDDVVGECNQFGGVYHVHIDRKSARGDIYVKCPSIYVANKCVSTLHGRSFDGRLITANYIPLEHYHKMFPESVSVKKLVRVED